MRQSGITDTDVLSAIERVPREEFIPPAFQVHAYEDQAVPIGLGQTISQPYIVAYMTEKLELEKSHIVLEIGTGSGYQAAVLAQLARRVYTIERHRPLLELAERRFSEMKLRNITTLAGDGMKGWPGEQQFDRIIVTASSAEEPSPALLSQLKIGGILIIPVGAQTEAQILKRYKKESEDVIAIQNLIPVRFVPLIPHAPRQNSYNPEDLDSLTAWIFDRFNFDRFNIEHDCLRCVKI